MSTAIITGASSGMGREFARTVQRTHPEIDTLLLIARRRERLEALAEELKPLKCELLPLDLTDNASFDTLKEYLTAHKSDVRLLINNAGFGILGNVADGDIVSQTGMTRLNCAAVTAMCITVLPFMQAGSVILNVSSIASFAPTPRMAVYGATKAYVRSFSMALRSELKNRHINVLALCPGPMDTEFLDVAGISGGKSPIFEKIPHLNCAKVAEGAVKQAFRGKSVYTPALIYKVMRVVMKLVPHVLITDSMTC